MAALSDTVVLDSNAVSDLVVRIREVQQRDLGDLGERISQLALHHSGAADCRAVAEAEAFAADVLLTSDKILSRHLRDQTTIVLASPADYWNDLGVPRGTDPQSHFIRNGVRLKGWWDW